MAVIRAKVIRGHRVASGENEDSRFPGGTLSMQLPFFRKLGLDLSGYHLATLNLSVAPLLYRPVIPHYHFENISWHPTEPAEDFSFFDCRIRRASDEPWINGLIYYPHPETKPDHFQPPDMLEVIAKQHLEGISYGSDLEMKVPSEQLKFFSSRS